MSFIWQVCHLSDNFKTHPVHFEIRLNLLPVVVQPNSTFQSGKVLKIVILTITYCLKMPSRRTFTLSATRNIKTFAVFYIFPSFPVPSDFDTHTLDELDKWGASCIKERREGWLETCSMVIDYLHMTVVRFFVA